MILPNGCETNFNLRQPKPIRGSVALAGRKFSPIEKSLSIERPSNPMMHD